MENRFCANCGITFVPKTHNQKYHDDMCCRDATNSKIMERYYATKARRSGAERFCIECDAKLSRYNDDDFCSMHAPKKLNRANFLEQMRSM